MLTESVTGELEVREWGTHVGFEWQASEVGGVRLRCWAGCR